MLSARMLSSSRIPLTMPVDSEYKACDFPYKRRQGAGVRVVPSGMGLPDVWTEEMDRVICYCEAVGELPLKTVIASLKKKFPQLDKHTISELSLEKRLWCLDFNGDNDYFVKGAEMVVERLRASGHVLPQEPDWKAIDEAAVEKRAKETQKASAAEPDGPVPITPPSANASGYTAQPDAVLLITNANHGDGGSDVSSNHPEHPDHDRMRRYSSSLMRDPFTAFREPPSPDRNRPVSIGRVRSDSTVRMPSRDTEHSRPEGSDDSATKLGPTGIRRVGSTGSRVRDVAPVATLQHLRISEDDPQFEGSDMYLSKPVGSVLSNATSAAAQSVASSAAQGSSYSHVRGEGHSLSPHVTDYSNTSYGSPRTSHGRTRPWPPHRNPGSGRRNREEFALVSPPTMSSIASASRKNRNENMRANNSTLASSGSGRRISDENMPLSASNAVDYAKREDVELPILSSRRYV
ncbi:MAG: hypothetical protein LQ350_004481 [Teloschistes chrysophthalmus]|nr:MAG: hypothetical protein LQ350_004481 [Niorma chrysophthalma]